MVSKVEIGNMGVGMRFARFVGEQSEESHRDDDSVRRDRLVKSRREERRQSAKSARGKDEREFRQERRELCFN